MDESIIKSYNQYITAGELLPEDIISMNGSVEVGTKEETKVIQFHKRIITTMNDDFPPVESLNICAK